MRICTYKTNLHLSHGQRLKSLTTLADGTGEHSHWDGGDQAHPRTAACQGLEQLKQICFLTQLFHKLM